jgi:5-methylcytosine-specific restriction protein A
MIARPSARHRGYDSKWDKARADYLAKHPDCVMCLKAGMRTQATVVDHRTPHKGDMHKFWDKSNWQSLCYSHHNSDKQRIERGGKPRPVIGADGWPVDSG